MTDGDTGFRVGSYIDQLVATMPRLDTGLLCLCWSICIETYGAEEADFTGRKTSAVTDRKMFVRYESTAVNGNSVLGVKI